MFLSKLRIWNFRKYGSNGEINLSKPNLEIVFNKGINVLIGENDSGKSAIIDAIKIVIRTHSFEWLRVENEDFYKESNKLRIEIRFDDFTDEEAKNFTEWLGWEDEKPFLKINFEAFRAENRIIPSDIKAGPDPEGYILSSEAREYLKTTYLKPLRDAKSDLVPKKYSRLSQILNSHSAFKGRDQEHKLVGVFNDFNTSIEKYFLGKDSENADLEDQKGKELKTEIDNYVKHFYNNSATTLFSVNKGNLISILEKLLLSINDDFNPGLGTLNRLYMAAELLHLNKENWNGLRLGLIEELEAHIHPQAQMKVVEYLQSFTEVQLILTTHSPNLASKIKLENLFVCSGQQVFPMGKNYTQLSGTDYKFLERFLDTTKANLFFAKGIIFVEGWAEEILIPSLAKKMKELGLIKEDLTEAGVSIVNVGNTAFLRYVNIFKRKIEEKFNLPIAVITDLDLKPIEFTEESDFIKKRGKYCRDRQDDLGLEYNRKNAEKEFYKKNKIISVFKASDERLKIEQKYSSDNINVYVSNHWTLEYCFALSKFNKYLYKAVLLALKEQRIDDGQDNLEKYDLAILKMDEHFNNWTDSKEKIAYSTYQQILGNRKILNLRKEKISKAIIAQHLSFLIEDSKEINEEYFKDLDVSYIIDAVKYVCG